MNVLVIGRFHIEGFALHIAETLSEMGHATRRFELGFSRSQASGKFKHRFDQVAQVIYEMSDSVPAIRTRRIRELWEIVDQGPLDLVIVCHDFLLPSEVAELKKLSKAYVVLWFPDSLGNFRNGYFMNAPYDVLYFKDPYIVAKLEELLSSTVLYMPECFNPKRHWLPETEIGNNPDYQCDITTAGNLHSLRIAVFRHLAKYDSKIWGKPPPLWINKEVVEKFYQGRPVYDHEKVRAFRGAKIVLNSLHFAEIWGVNVRAFEAAGAGAFQLINWRPALPQLFEVGKEIAAFHSPEDLTASIEKYLREDELRKNIAEAGMRRAFAEHTYELRLKLMIETMMGKERGFPKPYGVDWIQRYWL